MYVIVFIIFGLWIYTLGNKVQSLSEEVARLGGKVGASKGTLPETAVPENALTDATSGISPSAVPAALREVPGNSWADNALAWIKKDFMVKLGAFLLLLAFGWFVSYAFANNWIGPMGRITLGLCAGAIFMVLGIWRMATHPHQGGVFTVLGSTIILLTTYAARELYDFFTPASALAIMALSVVFVAFTSVRYSRNALALAGLILASIAPMFTSAPEPSVTGLFTYLTMVVLGTLWVVYLRGWSNLTFTALAIVFLYGMPYLMSGISSGDKDAALLFAFLFTAIFFIANILGLIGNENEENRKAHIAIALGTGLYLILWITGAADEHWQSLLYVMWMLVFSVGSFLVYRVVESKVPFYIYSATSVALLAAATAAELSGPVLTIAYTIEVSLLIALTRYLTGNTTVAHMLSWLFAGPILLSVSSMTSSAWKLGVFHDDLFVLVILTLCLALVGRLLYEKAVGNADELYAGTVLILGSAMYALSLVWLVLHALFTYDSATMLSLIVYTLIGLALIMAGRRAGKGVFFYGGSTLLALVIARLLLVEVWHMSITGRIITFLVIGTLLISTAFLKRRGTGITPHNESN